MKDRVNESSVAVLTGRRAGSSPRLLSFGACLMLGGILLGTANAPAQTVRATTFGTTSGTAPGSSRLSAGLQISVKITQGLNSKTASEGDAWDGVLAKDLIAAGKLVTPAGTQVTGVVSKVISAGRASGNGTLEVRLTAIRGTGISSVAVVRQGLNPALTSTGNAAAAGIPGEAAQSTAGVTPNTAGPNAANQAEARIAPGSILNFTTE